MSLPGMTIASVARLASVSVHRHRRGEAHVVLDDIHLDLRAAELVGVSGPSGSGKSTLAALLCGELEPTAGSVAVRTQTGLRPPWEARRAAPGSIGWIAQDARATLDPLWSILRSVEQPLRLSGVRAGEVRDRARAALARVGMGRVNERQRPGHLSVGQCQRVAVARALVAEPDLIVADEPTSALDVTTAASVAALLLEARSEGTAVLVASHDLRLLDAIADRRLHIRDRHLHVAEDVDGDPGPTAVSGVG